MYQMDLEPLFAKAYDFTCNCSNTWHCEDSLISPCVCFSNLSFLRNVTISFAKFTDIN